MGEFPTFLTGLRSTLGLLPDVARDEVSTRPGVCWRTLTLRLNLIFNESDGEMERLGFLKRRLSRRVAVWLAPVVWLALAVWLAACGGATGPVEPSIMVEPAAGAAGTEVTVAGDGFPAGLVINIRLGPPDVGATPLAYATATATEDGTFVTSFVLPAFWPDETPIVEGELLIIALVPDGSVKATAPFGFGSPPSAVPD